MRKSGKCPMCDVYSISYDPYQKVDRCMVDGCTVIIIDENTYSYLRHDPLLDNAERIKVVNDIETEVLKIDKL